MTDRIDDLEKYYEPIERFDKWTSINFFASAMLSIIILYSSWINVLWLQQLINVFFILLVIIHSFLAHYNGFYLIPLAEQLRRKQLLSNSLKVPLTHEKTKLYYNNEVPPSTLKLGFNIMENAFFAKNVCNGMAKKERVKISVYVIVWLLAIFNRSTNLSLILILTQVLFSGDILYRWIKIEVLRVRNEMVYEALYSLFLNNRSLETTPEVTASILDAFASYEVAKGAASLKQDSKIFWSLNSKLSEEWNEIKEQLGFR